MSSQIFTIVSSNANEVTQKLDDNKNSYWVCIEFDTSCCGLRNTHIRFCLYKGCCPNKDELVFTADEPFPSYDYIIWPKEIQFRSSQGDLGKMNFVTIDQAKGIYNHELKIDYPNSETVTIHSSVEARAVELSSYFKSNFIINPSCCCSGLYLSFLILLILFIIACICGIFMKSKMTLLIYYPVIIAVFLILIFIVICFYPRIFSRGKMKTKIIEFGEITTGKKVAEFIHVWIDRCHGSHNYDIECARELDEKQLLILVAGFIRYFHMCLIRVRRRTVARF